MPVRIGPDGGVVGHPYRLRRGICRQYVAIELLRGAGFDEGIVEEAVAIKNQLVNRRRKPCNKKAIKKSPKVSHES
jgi:DNA mismatch repair ATPase MutS